MEKKYTKIEIYFETFLFNFRFITLIAVIGSLVSSLVMFIKGALQTITGIIFFCEELSNFPGDKHQNEALVPMLISAVDKYLFATVLLIFSMGLYELFISKIDPASRTEDTRPNWLQIESLDDLKGSLGKVILMILIVLFFEKSLGVEYKTALDLLFLALGIIFVSLALFLTHMNHKKTSH